VKTFEKRTGWVCALLAALTLCTGTARVCRAQTTTTTPIRHLVVIFQENVSFDHYFATYPNAANPAGEPAWQPMPSAFGNAPSVNGLSGALLTNNPNSAQPFRLTRAQAVTCDQGHNYTPEQKAFDHGAMDKFVENTGSGNSKCDYGYGPKLVMGYYDGNTATAMWNYAQRFAMNDNFFNTTFGPSTPGVLNLVSGQTHGAVGVLDNGFLAADVVNSTIIGDADPAFDDCSSTQFDTAKMTGPNVGDLLNAAGITWGWFQGGFKPSSVAGAKAVCGSSHTNIAGATVGDYSAHHEPFQYYASTSNPHHLPPTSVQSIGFTDQANHQYDLSDFWNAVNANNLPAVSYLKAAKYQDGHAGYSDPLDEQTFLVNTINQLQRLGLPDLAIMITYDDSDGWYDHVMPPLVSPSNTASDALTGDGACGTAPAGAYPARCGYGPRLPFLLISHYAKSNFVDHTVTDQSSILRFIEDNWSLGRIGDQSFDALAGSLMNMFQFNFTTSCYQCEQVLLNNGALYPQPLFLDPTTGQMP
jgi:phospholipase C